MKSSYIFFLVFSLSMICQQSIAGTTGHDEPCECTAHVQKTITLDDAQDRALMSQLSGKWTGVDADRTTAEWKINNDGTFTKTTDNWTISGEWIFDKENDTIVFSFRDTDESFIDCMSVSLLDIDHHSALWSQEKNNQQHLTYLHKA